MSAGAAAPTDHSVAVAAAYSATGRRWDEGPGRLYDRLAELLVAASPFPLAGRRVVDAGAGTGAASRAIAAAGGSPIAVDVSHGMLVGGRDRAYPAVVADVRRLPLTDAAVDAVVAAFSYNHVPDPVAALAEARRVTAPGGPVLVATYAAGDHHPVKAAVDRAASEAGWVPAPWVDGIRRGSIPLLADPERAVGAARAAGLVGARSELVTVAFPELGPVDLVEWRLGMAQLAPFVAGLEPAARDHLVVRALQLLGPVPPLVRRIVVLTALAT